MKKWIVLSAKFPLAANLNGIDKKPVVWLKKTLNNIYQGKKQLLNNSQKPLTIGLVSLMSPGKDYQWKTQS